MPNIHTLSGTFNMHVCTNTDSWNWRVCNIYLMQKECKGYFCKTPFIILYFLSAWKCCYMYIVPEITMHYFIIFVDAISK